MPSFTHRIGHLVLVARCYNVLHPRYIYSCSNLAHALGDQLTLQLSTGASIAEIVSAFPTCGGLYTASAQLCPRKHRPIVGWVVGWLNILGQVAGVSSTEFGLANMIWAAVSIAKVSSHCPITPGAGQSQISAFYITGWRFQHYHR